MPYVKIKKTKPHQPGRWSVEKRYQVVADYIRTGSNKITSELNNIPIDTIRTWRYSDWWKDVEAEIKAESNAILDAKLTDVADEAILAVRDRLKNGDFVLTKDGDISRVPVKARDASTIAKDMLTQRREIRLEKTERVESTTVDARLEKLMSEFIKFAKAKTIDGESTELQEGVRVISGNPGTDQESIGAEQSSPGVREEARGHQEGHRSQETAV